MNLKKNILKPLSLIALLSFLSVGCTTSPKSNNQNYANGFENVEYIKNYDGDTITVNLKGQHPLFGKDIGVRVKGVDTPEIKGKTQCEKEKAKAAKEYVSKRLKSASSINLVNVSRGKYFRIVADVIVDGENLADGLISKGFAVYYDGGRKPSSDWCN